MASLKHNNIFKDPISKYSHVRSEDFNIQISGATIQSVRDSIPVEKQALAC